MESRSRISLRELVLYPILGALMFASDILMEALPNIHLLGMLIMVCTLAFRVRALIPIYIYVFLNGLFAGFALWWVPYLYIWLPLWGITLLLPRMMPRWLKRIVYPAVCAAHGLLFGVLYAPAQAMIAGLDLKGMVAWIITGIPYDILHFFGNLAAGMLVLPLSELLGKLWRGNIRVA